jgi:hypothetical protein
MIFERTKIIWRGFVLLLIQLRVDAICVICQLSRFKSSALSCYFLFDGYLLLFNGNFNIYIYILKKRILLKKRKAPLST